MKVYVVRAGDDLVRGPMLCTPDVAIAAAEVEADIRMTLMRWMEANSIVPLERHERDQKPESA